MRLLLLGANGIYQWYRQPRELAIGKILLELGLAIPLIALALTRIARELKEKASTRSGGFFQA